jgi:hypothetical protein
VIVDEAHRLRNVYIIRQISGRLREAGQIGTHGS